MYIEGWPTREEDVERLLPHRGTDGRRARRFEKALQAPRSRWYGSVRITRDGRTLFSPLTFKNLSYVSIRDKLPDGVDVVVGGRQALLLSLSRGRIASSCFVYTITGVQLRYIVGTLRVVTGGVESWIVPALEWMQSTPSMIKPDALAVIPGLLESCKDLPVAEIWRRRRRAIQQEWAQALRTHPERVSESTAPWMLPEGYRLPQAIGSAPGSKRRRPKG